MWSKEERGQVDGGLVEEESTCCWWQCSVFGAVGGEWHELVGFTMFGVQQRWVWCCCCVKVTLVQSWFACPLRPRAHKQ